MLLSSYDANMHIFQEHIKYILVAVKLELVNENHWICIYKFQFHFDQNILYMFLQNVQVLYNEIISINIYHLIIGPISNQFHHIIGLLELSLYVSYILNPDTDIVQNAYDGCIFSAISLLICSTKAACKDSEIPDELSSSFIAF